MSWANSWTEFRSRGDELRTAEAAGCQAGSEPPQAVATGCSRSARDFRERRVPVTSQWVPWPMFRSLVICSAPGISRTSATPRHSLWPTWPRSPRCPLPTSAAASRPRPANPQVSDQVRGAVRPRDRSRRATMCVPAVAAAANASPCTASRGRVGRRTPACRSRPRAHNVKGMTTSGEVTEPGVYPRMAVAWARCTRACSPNPLRAPW